MHVLRNVVLDYDKITYSNPYYPTTAITGEVAVKTTLTFVSVLYLTILRYLHGFLIFHVFNKLLLVR